MAGVLGARGEGHGNGREQLTIGAFQMLHLRSSCLLFTLSEWPQLSLEKLSDVTISFLKPLVTRTDAIFIVTPARCKTDQSNSAECPGDEQNDQCVHPNGKWNRGPKRGFRHMFWNWNPLATAWYHSVV